MSSRIEGSIKSSSEFRTTTTQANNETCCSCCAKICAFVCAIFSDLNRTRVHVYTAPFPHASDSSYPSSSGSSRTTCLASSFANHKLSTVVPLDVSACPSNYSDTGAATNSTLKICSSQSHESFSAVLSITPKAGDLRGMKRLEEREKSRESLVEVLLTPKPLKIGKQQEREDEDPLRLSDIPTPKECRLTGMQRLEECDDP